MKKKKKIITHNKNYPLSQSPLFNIQYIKRLASALRTEPDIILSTLSQSTTNYHCFQQGKRDIQEPLSQLYVLHNRIASLLSRVTPPEYLYSGVKKRSYIQNAQAHLKANAVLTADITAFFPSTTRTMLFWFFKETMQCSTQIANLLADLCSVNGHLPTGSQISMPLAYWTNAKMFEELHLLAQENLLKLTVYVDDITFSGEKIPTGFKYQIERVIEKHQHKIKSEKTVTYTNQSYKEVTGLILKQGNLLPPNRQFKKAHYLISHWKSLISEPRNGIKIEALYKKLIGSLNNIAYFKPSYKNVISNIEQEYQHYINNPANYRKADTATS